MLLACVDLLIISTLKKALAKKCMIDFTVAMTTDCDVRLCQRLNLLKMSRMMILDAERQLLSFLNLPVLNILGLVK